MEVEEGGLGKISRRFGKNEVLIRKKARIVCRQSPAACPAKETSDSLKGWRSHDGETQRRNHDGQRRDGGPVEVAPLSRKAVRRGVLPSSPGSVFGLVNSVCSVCLCGIAK